MKLAGMRTVPVPGDGIVAHLPAAIVVVLPSPDQRDAAARLVAEAREVCGSRDAPGRALARRFAAAISSADPGAIPPLAFLAEEEDGAVLFLFGAVEAHVSGAASGAQDLYFSGEEAATWVDRVLGEDVQRVALVPLGAGPDPGIDATFELDGGVVPGSGIVIHEEGAAAAPPSAVEAAAPTAPPEQPEEPATDEHLATPAASATPAPAPPAPPAPPEAPPPIIPFEAVSLLDVAEVEAREPLPVAEEQVEVAAEDDPAVTMVEGIMCSRSHFNSPDALYCSSCGISMVHQTHNLVHGPRPPLGFLVFDDGATFTLDADYVMGREPEIAPGDAAVRPLVLDDPERSVSRVHAELRLVGWDVQLSDRGSANGTFVWEENSRQWQRIAPGAPTVVSPGGRVALGQRTFVYETPHKPHGR